MSTKEMIRYCGLMVAILAVIYSLFYAAGAGFGDGLAGKPIVQVDAGLTVSDSVFHATPEQAGLSVITDNRILRSELDP